MRAPAPGVRSQRVDNFLIYVYKKGNKKQVQDGREENHVFNARFSYKIRYNAKSLSAFLKFLSFLLLFAACFAPGAAWGATEPVNIETVKPNESGTGWDFGNTSDDVLTVSDGADIIVTGEVENGRRIVVAEGATASITLNGVSISLTEKNLSPLLLNAGAKLTLTLANGTENTLTAGGDGEGIRANGQGPLTTLTIEGQGSLRTTGTAIMAFGCTVTIDGGTVTADGAGRAIVANVSSEVTINGGTVTANGDYGTAIAAYESKVTINNGGTVTANGDYARAIRADGASEVTIDGGAVTADGGNGVAIIAGATSKVTISSGTVTADGGDGTAILAIGTSKVTISGGMFTAVGENGVAIWASGTSKDT
ncbi:MAG: carbohydrate-binding domain-containing protein, partial [Oscillospiraceae bacterium]|nr:carbohydrate-binding domain-containing protein [Oscillospiraceae bacterium]